MQKPDERPPIFDDEQKPLPLALLLVALLAAVAVFLLLAGARTPGSALSYSGGRAVTPYTMTTGWAPTLAAPSDDFTTDTSADWTLQAAGGTGSTVISPTGTPSVSLFNFTTFRPGWLAIQAESGTGAAVASKAYTLPTNVAAYARYALGTRETLVANDGMVGIGFAATSGGTADLSNMVLCSPQYHSAGTYGYSSLKIQAGVTTLPAKEDVSVNDLTQVLDVVLIQKRGDNYYCFFCLDTSGACFWNTPVVAWSGVATLDRLVVFAQNAATTTPGVVVQALDYVRVVEDDNALP
jgi:hypothetical protein